MESRPRVLNKRKMRTGEQGIYVGRPSRWGNYPGEGYDRQEAVERFRRFCSENAAFREAIKAELKGKNLICWCAPAYCHAEVLLEIANDLPPRGLGAFFT
ncbi:NrdA.1 conserved hypothetical protein [Delftia phage PhiW-14]|uniref:DUF4326 domain-containing protein n=1 Tax=Delftia phage PhiW-14 TaxID=665032 RepID=C9DG69_BPW14|nr:NrdA.1 conserved hypothetical protein [Delftia phage PhiW-14]ACV50120.1 NrdA.1 conserved hypothetical protein [Delftia phage PhiW-14]